MASRADINDDGLMDLILHVVTASLVLSPADEFAVLEGRTFSGTPISGKDTIRVIRN